MTHAIQLAIGLSNYVAVFPTVITLAVGLQHSFGVDFLQGHVYVGDCAQAAVWTSNYSIGLRINEVKLTQSFTAHFIEVQAVQTVAVNISSPECCQLNVSYSSGIQSSLLEGTGQIYLVIKLNLMGILSSLCYLRQNWRKIHWTIAQRDTSIMHLGGMYCSLCTCSTNGRIGD